MRLHIKKTSTVLMNALTLQNPRQKCDWETRMTTDQDKK